MLPSLGRGDNDVGDLVGGENRALAAETLETMTFKLETVLELI